MRLVNGNNNVPTIWLPIEIYNRELIAKLLLALKLVSKDLQVVLGAKPIVQSQAVDSSGIGVYLDTKGKSKNSDFLEHLSGKGIHLVSQDEESGISFADFSFFVNGRNELWNLDEYSRVYAWGPSDYAWLKNRYGGEKVLSSGSPRTAFWGKFGEEFFKPEVEILRARYGAFVTVITNFTLIHNLMSSTVYRRVLRQHGYSRRQITENKKRYRWEILARRLTMESVQQLLDETEHKVILRPHPGEDDSFYKNAFGSDSRVIIDKNTQGTPLLLASESVIHSGSTLGLESVFLGRKTVSLANMINSEGPIMNADALSHSPISIKGVIDYISSKDENPVNHEIEEKKKQLLFSPGNLWSVDTISRDFASLAGAGLTPKIVRQNSKLWRKSFETVRKFRNIGINYDSLIKGKRPIEAVSSIPATIDRLIDIAKINSDITISTPHPELFILTQR